MIIGPLLALAIPAALGVAVLSMLNVLHERITLALVGSIAGITVGTSALYVLSLLVPLSIELLVTASALMLGATAWLIYNGAWHRFKAQPIDKRAGIILLVLLLLFGIIAPKLLMRTDEGLETGIVNAYGDVAWHMANITSFAEGQSLPPENPSFSDSRLTYPFMGNFSSAALMTAGASYTTSVTIPALLLIPLLLTLLYRLAAMYTGSKRAGTIALLLLLFGGATFGFLRFGADLAESNQTLFEFLTHLPRRDYSGVGTDKDGFHFLNPVTSLLLPQRSFLYGMPLAFSILLLLAPTQKKRDASYLTAGVLAGVLPLFHAHTVIAMIPAIIALFALSPGAHWLLFALPAGIVGLPGVLYYARGEQGADAFFRYGPGWMSNSEPFLSYWFKNSGLLVPVAAAGLFFRNAPKAAKGLAIAGLTLFAAANLFLFAPWAWDNMKLLAFWLTFTLPLIGWVAAQGMRTHTPSIVRIAVIILIGIHILSAGLDIWKLTLPTATSWGEWTEADMRAAELIKQHTEPGEAIVTAPTHNSAVVLAGRPRYLGYSAHIWSHGGNPWNREAALDPFYAGQRSTLPEATPEYVFVGPQERSEYDIAIRESWKEVFAFDRYALYKRPITPAQ